MGNHPAWLMIVTGMILAVTGLVWLMSSSVPGLGRLPGDVYVEGDRFRFYFPVVTCILVSIGLSLAIWIVRLLFR